MQGAGQSRLLLQTQNKDWEFQAACRKLETRGELVPKASFAASGCIYLAAT